MKGPVFFVVIASTTLARVLLVNINAAEWGDSYRILRASNFVQHFSYPDDEKRPPLFSILLAARPNSVDVIFWGRIFMLSVSLASFLVFYKLAKKYLATQNQRLLAFVLLALNPVYLYWSLRIYADVPFSLLVLLCFYVFELWRKHLNNGEKASIVYLTIMGLICGLGILTRFEGYLLTLATLLGIAVTTHANKDTADSSTWTMFRHIATFTLTVSAISLPWLIYRNPLTSSYFEETSGRKYDFEMFLTYLVSYIFVLGVIPGGAFIGTYFFKRPLISLPGAFKKYPHVIAFILLESILILAWPAAVPRLFVPIIPFLVIAFVKSVDGFFINVRPTASSVIKRVGVTGVASILLTAIYMVFQNHLRLQFLGPHTLVFVFVSAMSIITTLTIVLNWRKLFVISTTISMLTLSVSTIYLHKDIYRSIKEISTFSLSALASGKIIHNDTASIVSWYLPKSEYKNLDDKKYLTQGYLQDNRVDYIILTNEFNPNLDIDLKKRPYLELTKESKYTTGGKMFFTWLIKVQK